LPDVPGTRVLPLPAAGAPAWSEALRTVAEALDAGEIVVLPAEGVYGLHARPDRAEAMARLRARKEREPGKGWIVLLDDAARLPAIGVAVPAAARSLVARHWPGALTVIFAAPASPGGPLPPDVVAPEGTVALRVPGAPFLRAAVAASGGLLVSTSANRAGAPAPARLDDAALDGIPLAVNGGTLAGVPSTLVRVDGSTVRVLRSGAVRIAPDGGDAS
jgi:L-threonylcarbamoyladenylate synthase